jgi:predicted nucleotidyltransferase
VDIESLLRSLNDHSVEYVLIGATAFPVHGYARATLHGSVRLRRRSRASTTSYA